MKEIRIITVGRLKTPHWKEAAAHYAKRLAPFLRLEESIVKDADPALPLAERKKQEGARILRQLGPGDICLCLDEGGKSMTSRAFADFLARLADTGKKPCFVIGGAYGLAPEVLARAAHRLALGPMTFPHELARVLLLEQIYRAESIMAGSGYHH